MGVTEPDPPSGPPWYGLPEDRRTPHPDRLSPASGQLERAMAAHDVAVDRGEIGYLDPVTGLFVMTAVTLWRRESCCVSGCRHCPYVARWHGREDEID